MCCLKPVNILVIYLRFKIYFLTGHQCELSDYLENSPKFRNFVGCFVSTLYLTYVLFTISSVARALFGTEKITGFTVESIKQFGIVDINEPKVWYNLMRQDCFCAPGYPHNLAGGDYDSHKSICNTIILQKYHMHINGDENISFDVDLSRDDRICISQCSDVLFPGNNCLWFDHNRVQNN